MFFFSKVHDCVGNSPGRHIMIDFFDTAVAKGQSRPAILGLTASPVQGKKLDGFELLEQTMHAPCITPTQYRDDLVLHTKRPSTHWHFYDPPDAPYNLSRITSVNLSGLLALQKTKVGDLRWPEVDHINGQFVGSIKDGDVNWTWHFIKKFTRKAMAIFNDLGPWAAEFYVHRVIRLCVKATKGRMFSENEPYLMALLQLIPTRRPPQPGFGENDEAFFNGLSNRVEKLVEILSGHEAEQPTGIIFVRERHMADVLAHVISIHPQLGSRFKVSHVMGMSNYNHGLESLLWLAPKDGRVPLLKFRNRTVNLLVATSVIEQGIDIPACNLVVCIDRLSSLKAFIQRRGRARDTNSKFHVLVNSMYGPNSGTASAPTKGTKVAVEWEALEAEMKRMYEDGLRDGEQWDKEIKSTLDNGQLQPLFVEATGAQLTARDAKQHLHHFCSKLTNATFVDSRPIFSVYTVEDGDRFRASVQLPISLPVHLRQAKSAFSWDLPADANADAALQAYKAIYNAGLLTDNLLPPAASDDLQSRSIECRPGIVTIHETYRPWPGLNSLWNALLKNPANEKAKVFRHAIRIIDERGHELFEADLILPCALPDIQAFQIFWTAHLGRPWRVHIAPAQSQTYGSGQGQYHDDQDHAGVLLHAAYGHRWPLSDMHRLVRVVFEHESFDTEHLASRPFDPQIFANMKLPLSPDLACLIRGPDGAPFVYEAFLKTKPPITSIRKAYKGFEDAPEDAPYVALRPFPKIVGILHKSAKEKIDDDRVNPFEPSAPDVRSTKYRCILPANDCRVDTLPMAYVQFGALLPSLTQVLEVYLVAAELMSSTRLCQLAMRNLSLVATAISAPAARLPSNYEYLEFIGDSILKVSATVNCTAQSRYHFSSSWCQPASP